MKLVMPEHGSGKTRQGAETSWLLETYTDADWSANKKHRKSTSCAVHLVNGNFAYASSRTQRVISLSSAESELHSMVSGCSDAIFIKRCIEFLSCSSVTHQQWTDNSAARMLASRQGVGKIRHLSGKILWIQSMVLQQQVSIGQVPTAWNYSDIGTKPLSKSRLLALMNQLGATDPDTMAMIGQEEYEVAAEQIQSQQNLKRLPKMVLRMAAVIGLESGFSNAVAIEIKETCLPGQVCTGQASGMETGQASAHDEGNFWLWFTIIGLLMLVVGLFYKGYRIIKDLSETVQHVWK